MKKDERIKLFAEQIRWALRHYFDNAPDNRDILSNDISEFCWKVAEDNVEAKKELRDLFSKSPSYNEEWDYILINGNRTHEPNWDTVTDDTINLLRLNEKGNDFMCNCYIRDLIDGLRGTDCVEAYAIEKMAMVDDKIYHKGKKVSKMLRALFVKLGLDKVEGFEARYAKIADECNSRKIDFKYVLSTNPAFQVTMSNPQSDRRGTMLQSCHSLNSNYEYQNGCSGYARDNYSFITFIPSVFDDKETWVNRKTMRQMFFYKPYNGVLIQSRLYDASGGLYGDQGEVMKIYRDLVQREISLCENEVNSWNTKRYNHHDSDSEFTLGVGKGFGGYPDWRYCGDFDIRQSIRKGKTDFVKYKAGAAGRCMACGCLTDEGDNVFCKDCGSDCRCDQCGDRFDEDDMYYVYNRYGEEVQVCDDCSKEYYGYCNNCGDYHWYEDGVEIDDEWYCESCRDQYLFRCDDCGEWYRKDERTIVGNGDEICDSCLDNYTQCSECGEWVKSEDTVEIYNGEDICEDCMDRYYFECEECGEVYPNGKKVEKDGKELCKDCAGSKEEIA